MHQIKIFKGVENELSTIEATINEWIAESGARIVQVFGNMSPQSIPADMTSPGLSGSSFAPSDIFLVVVYEK